MERNYYVYILANKTNSTIYIGVTRDISRRIDEHTNKYVDGFCEKYNVNKLVYCEVYNDIKLAIAREKQLKGWTRAKKNALIESVNPKWQEMEI